MNIQKTGIIGEGKMGSGIFHYLLDFGFDLAWICSPAADTEKLRRQLEKRLKRSLEAGILSRERYEQHLLTPVTPDLSALSGCDLLIEAIPEETGLKRELFDKVTSVVDHITILASNSSSLPPSSLLPEKEWHRSVGLHFFYPVMMKDIVEVTLTPFTSDETRQAVEAFLASIRRKYIVTDEKNAFILNRIFLDVQNQAYLFVRDGAATMEQMDELVREHLFPFGVFDFCDSVGLDTMLASVRNYISGYPDQVRFRPFIDELEKRVTDGKFGMKSGEGFYLYPATGNPAGTTGVSVDIADSLRSTWENACRDYATQAGIPRSGMDHALKEYFGMSPGTG